MHKFSSTSTLSLLHLPMCFSFALAVPRSSITSHSPSLVPQDTLGFGVSFLFLQMNSIYPLLRPKGHFSPSHTTASFFFCLLFFNSLHRYFGILRQISADFQYHSRALHLFLSHYLIFRIIIIIIITNMQPTNSTHGSSLLYSAVFWISGWQKR